MQRTGRAGSGDGVSDKFVKTSFFVILEGKEDRYSRMELKAMRLAKRVDNLPKLNENEVPIRVNVTLPKALFRTPELSINIAVMDDIERIEIDADTQDDLAKRAQEIIGLPVYVQVALPESEDDNGS